MYAGKYGSSLGLAGAAAYNRAMTNENQTRPCEQIRSLLRGLRSRLDPAIPALGEHRRLSTRRGKIVSQEELAEAVGVSRGWYAMLERGEPVQPSLAMLNRVARALNATRDERVTLFQLAIPELQGLWS
jgi:DNA-binding XRE family transcriptional regulator